MKYDRVTGDPLSAVSTLKKDQDSLVRRVSDLESSLDQQIIRLKVSVGFSFPPAHIQSSLV